MWGLCSRFKDCPLPQETLSFLLLEDECEPLDICQRVRFVISRKSRLQMTDFSPDMQSPCIHMEQRPHIRKQANDKLF